MQSENLLEISWAVSEYSMNIQDITSILKKNRPVLFWAAVFISMANEFDS